MFAIFFIFSAVNQVQCHSGPLVFAAPSAVSHQSRIDIKHTPSYIATPVVYSPISTIYASGSIAGYAQEAVLTPILPTDTLLTPVALSFFHNLPLARALEHPISIDKAQAEANVQTNTVIIDNAKVIDKLRDEANNQIVITVTGPEKLNYGKFNEISVTSKNNDEVTLDPFSQETKSKLL
ncbi:hypothetical protein K1T71_006163 [Dendrolimus kikuchii]|uniref:Uncharacterized protein n=1 Tax=Dendrolimus kikuchii TaxID=765133 RepID=A0ACC1D3K1_9NEOP|nr:hypothetical protein K1T71_006163 [Dendrolimus kikuchii]